MTLTMAMMVVVKLGMMQFCQQHGGHDENYVAGHTLAKTPVQGV